MYFKLVLEGQMAIEETTIIEITIDPITEAVAKRVRGTLKLFFISRILNVYYK